MGKKYRNKNNNSYNNKRQRSDDQGDYVSRDAILDTPFLETKLFVVAVRQCFAFLFKNKPVVCAVSLVFLCSLFL